MTAFNLSPAYDPDQLVQTFIGSDPKAFTSLLGQFKPMDLASAQSQTAPPAPVLPAPTGVSIESSVAAQPQPPVAGTPPFVPYPQTGSSPSPQPSLPGTPPSDGGTIFGRSKAEWDVMTPDEKDQAKILWSQRESNKNSADATGSMYKDVLGTLFGYQKELADTQRRNQADAYWSTYNDPVRYLKAMNGLIKNPVQYSVTQHPVNVTPVQNLLYRNTGI